MFSKRAAARRRRAAEPDVSVAVARAERRLEKHSARSSSSTRGASLGDAVAYAAIALGMCLMLFSRRIPVHGPEDFAPMRRAGRLAARALAHVEPHVVPGVDTGTLDDVVRAFLESRGGARALGYRGYNHSTCISPNEVVCHGVPSARVVLRAGDIVNVDVAVVTSEGWHGGVSRTLFVGGARRRMPPRVGWWTRRGTRSDWGWRRVGRARGSVTCWSRSRGGCARRVRRRRPVRAHARAAIPPAADDSARRRREKRGVAVAAGALLHDRADGDRKRVGRNRDAPRRVDGRHRGPRLAERAVRAHRRGGRARVRDLHARRRSVTTTTRLRESVSLLYARSSG